MEIDMIIKVRKRKQTIHPFYRLRNIYTKYAFNKYCFPITRIVKKFFIYTYLKDKKVFFQKVRIRQELKAIFINNGYKTYFSYEFKDIEIVD